MNSSLLNQLYDAYDFLYIDREYRNLINRFEQDSEACRQKYLRIKNEKVTVFHLYLGLFYVGMIWMIMGCLLASQIKGGSFLILLLIAAVVVAFLAVRKYIKIKKKKPEKNAEKFWNEIGSPTCVENNKNIEKVKEELRRFSAENDYVLEFLPEDYRDSIETVAYMIHVIKNGLADNLKEALQQYLEQQHRREMEATMRGMAASMELHNMEMESYMEEISAQQRITNSRLADIETLTFLDYVNNR